ncbi:MAG: hypothetical protein HQK97_07485 [Nitrospirae bacterium]|nr:hypothetical protein [Nitrospirota bacterium]
MPPLPFPLSKKYENILRHCKSTEELRSLAVEISDDVGKNPKDIEALMMLLIQCYMKLDDIDNAEIEVDKYYRLTNGNVPSILVIVKAEINHRKGNTIEAIDIIRQLLNHNVSLDYGIKVQALALLAIYNAALFYYEEVYNAVKELWYLINHEDNINFEDDNLFYSRLSQYADTLPFVERIMDQLKSYLNGKELLKNKTYSDVYECVNEYAKGNPLIARVIPYEMVDCDFKADKYFSLRIIANNVPVEDIIDLETDIYHVIESKYPDVPVLVDVAGGIDASH